MILGDFMMMGDRMQRVHLKYVDNAEDIQDSLDSFNKILVQHRSLARDLLGQTTYWVYSPNTKNFGPSKFVGFKKMNFTDYEAARHGPRTGNAFHGHETR